MSKKTVLITGCSEGGIGFALAQELLTGSGYALPDERADGRAAHQRGCRVFATARRLEAMEGLSGNVVKLRLDVLDDESISICCKDVLAQCDGKLDILVNNAGLMHVEPFADVELNKHLRVMDTNYAGLVKMTHAILPSMVARRSGLVVNVGSALGNYATSPFNSGYTASKAAVRAFTDSLTIELKPVGVNVMLVAPGIIASNIYKNISGADKPIWSPKPNSIYDNQASKKYVDMLAKTEKGGTSQTAFVKKIADKILARNPPRTLTGDGSYSTIWATFSAMPRGMRHFVETSIYGFRGRWADPKSKAV